MAELMNPTPLVDRILQAIRLVLLILLGKLLFVACATLSGLTPWPMVVMILMAVLALILIVTLRRRRGGHGRAPAHEDFEVVEHESGESLYETMRHPLGDLPIAEAAGQIA